MQKKPFISICIPAYLRVDALARLLNSIATQSFNDYEVVVSDDSPDDSVEQLVKTFAGRFPCTYFKNSPALGTPANWNAAIDKASGEWIKLMHDDDWFARENSLDIFASFTETQPPFIFSNYYSVDEEKEINKLNLLSTVWKKRILREPFVLYASNRIGPPSVTMLHHRIRERYDPAYKWLVDLEYYIRVLEKEKSFTHIAEPLINIGLNAAQVTNTCFLNPAVELPEGLHLLEQNGLSKLKNIWVYDAWWRLFRNLKIRSEEDLEKYVPGKWPLILRTLLADQTRYSTALLQKGFFSKTAMSLSYRKNKSSIE